MCHLGIQDVAKLSLACRLVGLYTADAVPALLARSGTDASEASPAETLLELAALPGGPTDAAGAARLRAAALNQATPDLYEALGAQPDLQSRLFKVCTGRQRCIWRVLSGSVWSCLWLQVPLP
jgi:hypothetical protein